MERRAKIVATLGPSSSDPKTLSRILAAGVDVIRLNFSHGSAAEHRKTLRLVRQLTQEKGLFVPTLVDLMGPRYRLAEIVGGPRNLLRGARVTLGLDPTGVDLPMDSEELLRHVKRGERILIDNGLVELEVEDKRGKNLTARVLHGGPVSTRKGINLPDSTLPFTVSPKDRQDLKLALNEEADYVAVSYVGRARDLETVRQVMRELGGSVPLVAKLEQARALDHLDEIVESADALMVARGDLGVEVPLHRVPVLQKQIVDAARRAGKPVIVATQMLESMMLQPRPTRAESSDVANAVIDGADALMLSGETAAGRFPVKVVRTMNQIIREAERYQENKVSVGAGGPPPYSPDPRPRNRSLEIPETVAAAAVYAAQQLNVRRIVAFSQGGFTARMVAKYRPSAPIIVFTTDPQVARQTQLVWGVRPLFLRRDVQHHDQVVKVVDERLLAARLARPGERIIVLMGDPIREKPLTNLLRVHRVRSAK